MTTAETDSEKVMPAGTDAENDDDGGDGLAGETRPTTTDSPEKDG